MKRALLTCCLLLCHTWAASKSVGCVGETFPVAETSFLAFIEARLKQLEGSGEWNAMQLRWQHMVATHANRPTPTHLSRTEKSHTHRYEPEVILARDIRDIKGRILYQKGTRLNALQKLTTYKPVWLFINADDVAQMAWVAHQLRHNHTAKIILTEGAVRDTTKALDHEIFFDQGGRITEKLGIKHVPSIVTREENYLLIHEVAIKEDGHARDN